MSSTPFEEEAPQASFSESPTPAIVFALGFRAIFPLIAVFVAGYGLLVLGSVITPFRYFDAMLIIAVAIGPAALVLCFLASNGTLLRNFAAFSILKKVNLLCGIALFFVVGPGNVILYANQALDRSAAVTDVVPVKEAWIRTGRHDARSFMVGVDSSVANPPGRFSVYGEQPIRLEQAEWQRVVPGQTSITLRVHPGVFGFAWYEPDPRLSSP